jgi:hypothetical protein
VVNRQECGVIDSQSADNRNYAFRPTILAIHVFVWPHRALHATRARPWRISIQDQHKECSMKCLAAIAVVTLCSAQFAVAQSAPSDALNPALAKAQQEVNEIVKQRPIDYAKYSAAIEHSRALVYSLIAQDSLRTAADFYTASILSGDPSGFYEYRRVDHELALMSLVLGHPDAIRRVGLTWDGLNWSWGRGQRLGSYKRDGVAMNMDPVPAPPVVAAVFNDLAAARAHAAKATNNAELETLRTADQADREPPIDLTKQQLMMKNDPVRRARVLELVASGVPATGRDFHNAALVLQHGNTVDDFRLAHELSIAAVALGDTGAVWLLSRTYDRLLLHMGHRQRLNTQYGGAATTLLPLDTTAVNDRIRRGLGSRALADAQKPPM